MKTLKPATADVVTCPMCNGHGKVERADVVSKLQDRDFNRTLQYFIDEVTYGPMRLRDVDPPQSQVPPVPAGEREGTARSNNFKTGAHSSASAQKYTLGGKVK